MDTEKVTPLANKKRLFLALSADQKIRFLALLAHEITIAARGAYPERHNLESSNELTTFNELQHSITSQLAHMLEADEKRYPDEVFIDILEEKAQTGSCESDFTIAFDFALSHLPPSN